MFQKIWKHLKPFDMFYSIYYFWPLRQWRIFPPKIIKTPNQYIECANVCIDPDLKSEGSHFDIPGKQNPWTSWRLTFAYQIGGSDYFVILPWCTPWKPKNPEQNFRTFGLNKECAEKLIGKKFKLILIKK